MIYFPVSLLLMMCVCARFKKGNSSSEKDTFFSFEKKKSLLDGVPVVLVLAGVLAVVDGGDLEDAEGALAGAADRRAAALVRLLARGGGGAGLLGLGERGRGDGAQGQEGHERSGGRHFDACVCGWLFWERLLKGGREWESDWM